MLAHCLRRWPNIKPTSVQRLGHTVWPLRSLAMRFSVWRCCFLCHAVFLATRVWPCRVYSCSLALHHTRLSVYGARIAWIQPILPVSVLLCDCSRLSPPSGLIQEVCLSRQQPPTQQISTHPLYLRLLESTYLPDWRHLPIYQAKSPSSSSTYPANTRHRPNVDLMLGQRRRRWPNIKPTLGRCLVFAGYIPN